MSFELLDPRIREVLREKNINEPTGAQQEAIPRVLDGRNVLVVAHTGIGKTEAAMLPIFDRLLKDAGRASSAYTSLLSAPLTGHVEAPNRVREALDLTSRSVMRYFTIGAPGSIQEPAARAYHHRRRAVLFTGRGCRDISGWWVVIDEIHELAGRESSTVYSLGRLAELAGSSEDRTIGHVGSVEEVANYLAGVGREVDIVRTHVSRSLNWWRPPGPGRGPRPGRALAQRSPAYRWHAKMPHPD